ncbi:MAG: hypothetical protein DMG37_22845 [Acidobacteria bacterium]|nr:MAG: hypothetical protein DMG37_22845 [Acidobacteriota bacterium]
MKPSPTVRQLPKPADLKFAVQKPRRLKQEAGLRIGVTGVISGIDKLLGKLVEDRLGVLNQRLRCSLMNGIALTPHRTPGDWYSKARNPDAVGLALADPLH